MKIIKGGKYVFKIDQGKNVVKRVEKTGKGAGELNKDLAKAYLRDIEAKTGRKVNKDQIHLIKEALRNKNYEKLTPKEIVLDKNGEVARRVSQPYDAHHIIENNFGGAHEWWNNHPAKYPNEHQSGIHGKGAPSGKLFPRR
ncbi:hypothetical protein B4133_3376 [Bacillus altitudinis]|nr:hypothetical protein B4133_3376 [Bacillus altitudinis]